MSQLFKVPKYAELSVEKLWAFIQEWDDLLEYFLDIDSNRLPERDFMLGVLSTLRKSELRTLVKTVRESRSICNNSDQRQMIEIDSIIRDNIFSILPQKSKFIQICFIQK